MRIIDNVVHYSASDIASFLDCPHILTLDRLALEGRLDRPETDGYVRLIQDKGNRHELAYLEQLKASGSAVVEISNRGTLADRLAATSQALTAGPDIIYQAALKSDPFMGYADFLRKVDRPSRLGAYSYEVVDTKLSHKTKARYVIQLANYSRMLAEAQGFMPEHIHVVTGAPDDPEKSLRLDDYLHYYQHLETSFLETQTNQAETQPTPCTHCAVCTWKPVCKAHWISQDHLCQVANIRNRQIQKLETAGIRTLEQLALTEPDGGVADIQPETFRKLQRQASLQYRARQDGKPIYELLADDSASSRGFNRLPSPNPGDLFFDMEGDPLYEGGGLEYLFGVTYLDDGRLQFKTFWALNRNEEKAAFEAFMDFVTERLRTYPSAHIYHYAAYEQTALKKLMSRHGTREAQVDSLLRQKKLVDLYQVVKEGLQVSTENYSIKSLERFYLAEKRGGEVTQGGDSVVWFERYLGVIGDGSDKGNKKLLKDIEDYNKIDCDSTYYLREWLLSLTSHKANSPPAMDAALPEAVQPISEWEQRLQQYRQQLLRDIPDETVDLTDDQRLRLFVFRLLDFHRRADKPQWWKLYDRRDNATPEDLQEDSECLAGLRLVGSPTADGNHLIYTYRYPAQFSKLTTGSGCVRVDTLGSPPGNVLDLDEDNRLVRFRISRKQELPEALDITVSGPLNHKPLREGLCRFADALLEGKKVYSAVSGYLRRERPRIAGYASGTPIIDPAQPTLSQAIAAVTGLDHSHLFIQGPPGTGKTYTASHIILKLLQDGKKVGVTSNSHKAINNLLAGVEKVALAANFRFKGAKRSSSVDQRLEGSIIQDVAGNAFNWCDMDLVAGTAWLFAQFDQTLDYLFVDEAGQVAVANLVAMGLSAKNLVLLGDQMQLGQPIQGDHPGDSGQSTLEYLLRDEAVIPPDRGIFLKTTWRMHPDVCRFISKAVYEGQLESERSTWRQGLVLKEHADPVLIPTGIRFEAVSHRGCSQRSEEEAERVKAIYQSLLQQGYRDIEGNEHPMTPADILVLSPWNMQVNLLKRMLPVDARVGTVDKFQGQEAQVVIISMATSSGEELPRDMEFLFSRNRLNVSISRARALAILIANPELLNVNCSNTEQMALVNTMCWLKEVGSLDQAIAPSDNNL
jgi:predicted RecB family nuclease